MAMYTIILIFAMVVSISATKQKGKFMSQIIRMTNTCILLVAK